MFSPVYVAAPSLFPSLLKEKAKCKKKREVLKEKANGLLSHLYLPLPVAAPSAFGGMGVFNQATCCLVHWASTDFFFNAALAICLQKSGIPITLTTKQWEWDSCKMLDS